MRAAALVIIALIGALLAMVLLAIATSGMSFAIKAYLAIFAIVASTAAAVWIYLRSREL